MRWRAFTLAATEVFKYLGRPAPESLVKKDLRCDKIWISLQARAQN
jgi:hypothetical protein